MTNILLKQFTEGRFKSVLTQYTKIIGHKSPKALDQVIPSLSANLFRSTEAFIEAVMNFDKSFVQQTATLSLQKKLLVAMEDVKRSQVEIKQIHVKTKKSEENLKVVTPKEGQQADLKRFTISPYVIFGQKMEQRFKSLKQWESMAPIFGLNRYIYINPLEGFSWQKIKNDHIYGFHCHFLNLNKGYQVYQGGTTVQYNPQQFVVTFETDAVNQQFFVADFNYIVKYGE